MALDGVFLHLVKEEISEILIGGRIEKIHQPSREELVLQVRAKGGTRKLIISIAAGTARVHITVAEIENLKSPPMFCMLMRKHLSSGRLVDIRQDGQERILYFDFESANELGDMQNLTLVVEIMGRHSNLILVGSDGKIIDSIKRVNQEMSSVRLVLPGVSYHIPPREEKLSLIDFDAEKFSAEINKFPTLSLSKAIMKIIEGISPVFAREAEFYTAKGNELTVEQLDENSFARLIFFLKNTSAKINSKKNSFTVLKDKDGALKDFCFTEINQYGNLMVTKQIDNACSLLDFFFSERNRINIMKQRAQDLFKLLMQLTDRTSRRIAVQKEELLLCANRFEQKVYGDLISANLYQIEKGMDSIVLGNFYEEGNPQVKIKLDKRLSPPQNAQKYYSEYRKADTAEKKLTELVKSGEEELLYIESVFDSLTRAVTDADISELRLELAEQGYIKNKKSKGKIPKAQPPLKFISSDGFTILVGRNNKQNDKLTTKDADKTDIWCHTHDITGSHVIIITEGGNVPDKTIEEACVLAAFHSSARNSAQVPVDFTLIKYVKKPNGAKPGMVIFTNNKTAYVTPDSEIVERLRVK